jgi:hypothetical protein
LKLQSHKFIIEVNVVLTELRWQSFCEDPKIIISKSPKAETPYRFSSLKSNLLPSKDKLSAAFELQSLKNQ